MNFVSERVRERKTRNTGNASDDLPIMSADRRCALGFLSPRSRTDDLRPLVGLDALKPHQHSTPPAAMATDDSPPRNWLELPREITTTILLKLGAVEILEIAQRVCTAWRSICQDPAMWRSIDLGSAEDLSYMFYDLEVMCRQAVDRSRGGCVDFNIECFGTDELLQYLTDRCNDIRRLRLVSCNSISDEGLSKAAAKLPLLEVLELSYCSFSKEALEIVGRCCPLLKSFKLNSQGYRYPHIECDDEADAIAKNMHELRHLQLFGNKMTNEGLKAILDGCPYLEYLDLRQCFNVKLGNDLGERCTARIKDLRRPHDPTDDYEFGATVEEIESVDDAYPSDIDDYEYGHCDYDDFTTEGRYSE